ncbi:hypothetical protein [Angelakisella massiliensis]|uniref:hypothetical protein n=1 Tax=Angelakisella massiliensis TaxID=1871018 RepID=UPI0008F8FC98|nr:hypothetical protein [Angelakisella massiliensis]
MRLSGTTSSLLDDWANQLGLLYLSDLKYGELSHHQLAETLKEISPQSYPCNQWNDAVEYFTQKPVHFSSSYTAKAYLLGYLKS